MHCKIDKDIQAQKNYYYGMQVENIASHQECNMAWIQSQFSFWRPVPNLFKFELNVVCKFILIYKCVLRLRNKSKHRKKGIMRAYLNLYVASYSRGKLLFYLNPTALVFLNNHLSLYLQDYQGTVLLYTCVLNIYCPAQLVQYLSVVDKVVNI